jgi:hypothetical protein
MAHRVCPWWVTTAQPFDLRPDTAPESSSPSRPRLARHLERVELAPAFVRSELAASAAGHWRAGRIRKLPPQSSLPTRSAARFCPQRASSYQARARPSGAQRRLVAALGTAAKQIAPPCHGLPWEGGRGWVFPIFRGQRPPQGDHLLFAEESCVRRSFSPPVARK